LARNNQSFISITDNGKGADLEQFKALYDETEVTGIKSGLGLHLIRDMAKAISCSVSLDKKIQNGTSLVLIFTK
jgi:signal transduction histidine kinase